MTHPRSVTGSHRLAWLSMTLKFSASAGCTMIVYCPFQILSSLEFFFKKKTIYFGELKIHKYEAH